jgi:cell division protein FtsB
MTVSGIYQSLLGLLPAPMRNKYFLILIAFFLMLLFFDKHDFITQIRLQRTVNKLEEDKAIYLKKIEEAEAARADFEENKERFAREQYKMKRPDEEVFIIVEEE